MKYLQPLVLTRAVQYSGYRLGIRGRVLKVLYAFCAIRVDVRGTAYADVPNSRVEGGGNFG